MEQGFPFVDDAHLEARRAQLEFKEPKELVCPSKNKVTKMCIKPSCIKLSLFCDKKECPSCKGGHKDCPIVSFGVVTESLNKHTPTKKYVLEHVGAIENEFLKSLREASNRLGKDVRFAGLSEKSMMFAEDIYDKSNAKGLKGKEAAEFFDNIKEYEQSKTYMNNIQKLLFDYEDTLQKVLTTATEVKRLLCGLFGSKASNKEITPNIVKPKNVPNIFDSIILGLNQGHISVLKKFINEGKEVKKIERLFRASEHNFSAVAFHHYCDGQEDTLVLIRTEFGKLIGGYTHYAWASIGGEGEWVHNSGRRAFLFSLDMKEKFWPQRDNQLIYRYSAYGPTFGGSDLRISDSCNKNSRSCAIFPTAYNRQGGYKLARNKDTYRMFSGGDNEYFKVQEYQVFRLSYL